MQVLSGLDQPSHFIATPATSLLETQLGRVSQTVCGAAINQSVTKEVRIALSIILIGIEKFY